MADRLPLPEPDYAPLGHNYYNARSVHAYADAENAALLRWKSTNAPRLEALQGLLEHAQLEAAKGVEAIASLESERAANAILTDEVAALRAELERLRTYLDTAQRRAIALGAEVAQLRADIHSCHAGCTRAGCVAARLTAERDALREDAERYRWLRNNPEWLGWDSDFQPDEVEREIDEARGVK